MGTVSTGISYPVDASRTYWVPTAVTRRLRTILQGCTLANGYASNLGADVRIGQLRGAATEAPAVFVIPGRESGEPMYDGTFEMVREYEIKGIADTKAHPEIEDFELIDRVIWDVRKCIEAYDANLADMIDSIRFTNARPGYREDGGTLVGAAITYEIRMTLNSDTPDTAL
jgi:hypothetical protein